MSAPPIPCRWDGEAFAPLPRFAKLADDHFVIGQVYTLVERQDRSRATHGHFFALLHEAWLNLPENQAERFPTDEALRKYALIKAGYRDERSIVCTSKAEAHRLAAFIKPMDDFAFVAVSEAVVRVYTAKSQSMKAMGKAEFAASKEAVLQILAEMIGVDPSTLSSQAEAA